ncbi:hypothetical protein NG895_05415 [Aeoliella sp. ICT_H6.2]|uniref:Uncharacterized protein n=1 Tax=Aeoliella straminimaris TaxID=2954799 RepID=A0A9X2FBK7_9BACT|nr:hypothetical protein [Aeoliella straminimaris]MCO6043339.1 hypothetical protein [Aeoliella straminimaris]
MESKLAFTIFYAWQSDTPHNHSRHLIREALDEVGSKLEDDFGCSRKCGSPYAEQSGTEPASEFIANWPAHCARFLFEWFAMYDMHGDRIELPALEKFTEEKKAGAQRY